MTAGLVVETERLCRNFGEIVAVRDVSLNVPAGEVFGILGPNGSGKTTLMRMLCGLLEPSGGSGRVLEWNISLEQEQIKRRIGYMTQHFSLYQDLTVHEQLRFYAQIYGLRGDQQRTAIGRALEIGGLIKRRKQIVGTLSGGFKQRLALAISLLHSPALLILDEPTAEVDPLNRRALWKTIHELTREGTTALVCTHNMDEAERFHRVAFFSEGVVLASGTPAELLAQSKLRALSFPHDAALRISELLEDHELVADIAYHGHEVRIVYRSLANAQKEIERVLALGGIEIADGSDHSASLEDVFVSLVGLNH